MTIPKFMSQNNPGDITSRSDVVPGKYIGGVGFVHQMLSIHEVNDQDHFYFSPVDQWNLLQSY